MPPSSPDPGRAWAADASDASVAAEPMVRRALELVGYLEPHEHTAAPTGQKRELDAQLLREAARSRGLSITPLSGDTTLLGPPVAAPVAARPSSSTVRPMVIHKNMPATLSGLNRSVTNNKHLTKRVLAARGIPVARGRMVSTFDQALEVFTQMGGPVVTKPLVGSGGRGVTVGITTANQLRAACERITDRGRRIVIEEMVPGVDLRIMTIGGRAIAATLRVPANVLGDGTSAISDLVAAKNTARAANAYLAHSPLQITPAAEERLGALGLTPASVPPAGQRVLLQMTANISAGGDNYDVTGLVHPDLLELAEGAAACFPGATHAGMDILAERIDAGLKHQRAIVCEVNLNNEIPMHVLPMYGRPIPVHEMLIDSILRSRGTVGQAAASGGPKTPAHQQSLRAAPASAPPPVDIDDLDAIIAGANPTHPGTPEASRELDEELLSAQLTRSGYTEPHFRGALVFASRRGQDAVLHRSGRSVVSAELARRPEALHALARALGIPAIDPAGLRQEASPSAITCQLLFIDGEIAATLLSPPAGPHDGDAHDGDGNPGEDGHLSRATPPAVGLAHCPFPELLRYARDLGGPIGSTPILEMEFALQEGRSGRHWALYGIDPDPVLARFAFPGAGAAADPYPAAAAAILNAGSYVIPREG